MAGSDETDESSALALAEEIRRDNARFRLRFLLGQWFSSADSALLHIDRAQSSLENILEKRRPAD